MSRLLVAAIIAVLLLTSLLAADLALQNPDLEPETNQSDDRQQTFAETSSTFIDAIPIAMAVMVVGAMLAAVRVMGGP
jgi:hypothetical protein